MLVRWFKAEVGRVCVCARVNSSMALYELRRVSARHNCRCLYEVCLRKS